MFILRKTFAIESKSFDRLSVLLYKVSKTPSNRSEGELIEDELIVACDKRDRALNIVFDLLALYRSSRLNAERY